MNKTKLYRMIALLAGGAVLLGLELGYGIAFYIAVPIAILVYTACLFGFSLLTNDNPGK
jgi:hypothetical protein